MTTEALKTHEQVARETAEILATRHPAKYAGEDGARRALLDASALVKHTAAAALAAPARARARQHAAVTTGAGRVNAARELAAKYRAADPTLSERDALTQASADIAKAVRHG
jgi:hypothetical protein